MTKEYSTFNYPIWLTGIWMPEVQKISVWFGIMVLIAGASVLWFRQLGLCIAAVLLSTSAIVLGIPMIGKMVRYMSIVDHLPFEKKSGLRFALGNAPQVIILLFCNLVGPILCLCLMKPEDLFLLD